MRRASGRRQRGCGPAGPDGRDGDRRVLADDAPALRPGRRRRRLAAGRRATTTSAGGVARPAQRPGSGRPSRRSRRAPASFAVRATLEARRLPLDLVAIDMADLAAGRRRDPRPTRTCRPRCSTPTVPGRVRAIRSSCPMTSATGPRPCTVGDTFTLPVRGPDADVPDRRDTGALSGPRRGRARSWSHRATSSGRIGTDGFRTNSAFYVRADDSPATAAAIRAGVRDSAPFAAGRAAASNGPPTLRTSPIIDAIVLGVALAGAARGGLRGDLDLRGARARRDGTGRRGRPPPHDGDDPARGVRPRASSSTARRSSSGSSPASPSGSCCSVSYSPGLGLDRLVGSSLEIPVTPGPRPGRRDRRLRHRHRRPRHRAGGLPAAPGDPGQRHPPGVRMTTSDDQSA